MDWVVTFPWNEWPASRGLGGHHAVYWVVTIAWIGWPLCVEYTISEHYLGAGPFVGRQLRYLIDSEHGLLAEQFVGKGQTKPLKISWPRTQR